MYIPQFCNSFKALSSAVSLSDKQRLALIAVEMQTSNKLQLLRNWKSTTTDKNW